MLMSKSQIDCVTDHEGFEAVCLNVWVMQAAYFTYRQRYGELSGKTVHE